MTTNPPVEYIMEILDTVKPILDSEKAIIEVERDSVVFVGDIHGDLYSATKIFKVYQKTKDTFVFLGDYVDRGENSVEVILGLFRLKIENPDRILLLRGNHETASTNEVYGFYHELLRKYGGQGFGLYNEFNKVFTKLPIVAILNGKIFCVHGGIPKGYTFEDIRKNLRKGSLDLDDPAFQLLWNDPDESVEYFEPSFRGEGIYLFGEKAFNEFMKPAGLELMIRAHTYLPEGFKWFFNGKLLSLFSPYHYVGATLKPKIAKLKEDKIKVLDLTLL